MSKNPKKILELENEFYKKRPVNSRRKGSNFERAIAKKLNGRFETEEFCRTPGSGAFGTTHKNLPDHLKIHGDLITPERFLYVIECKSGYDVDLWDIFRPKSDLYEFIKQAERAGKVADKKWMVIYKKNRKKELVIVDEKLPIKTWFCIKDKYYVYLLSDILTLEDFYFLY